MKPRELANGQRAQLWIADAVSGEVELLFETDEILIEAPNWTLDGSRLVVKGQGRLWSTSWAAENRTRVRHSPGCRGRAPQPKQVSAGCKLAGAGGLAATDVPEPPRLWFRREPASSS